MRQYNTLAAARMALRFLIPLNWLFGSAILCLLVLSFLAEAFVLHGLGLAKDPQAIVGGRLIMAIGILATPVAHVVFSRLLAIVYSVRAGNPFIGTNAARLRTIAWSLLALELARIVVVAVAKAVSSPTVRIDIRYGLSVTPWLAILLIFVLAGVFEQGARMREEIEATI